MASNSSGRTSRLALGVSGQAFARAVASLNTLALVPILISAWGLGGYGEWVALTAVASYLSYSNFGLITTSAYEVVMAAGANDYVRAGRAFQMTINLVLFVVLPVILLLLAALLSLPLTQMLKLNNITHVATVLIIALVALQIWVQALRGALAAALYAAGSYGFCYYVAGFAKLIELASIAIAIIYFRGTQVSAAGIMSICAFFDALVVWLYARRAAPWAKVDLKTFDLKWVKSQIRPTIGLLLSTFANQGILVQGPRIALSALLSPAAVGLYSVYATAVRSIDQFVLMFAMPLGLEVANAAGSESSDTLYRMVTGGTRVAIAIFCVVASVLLLSGAIVFRLWTHGTVEFNFKLAVVYLIVSGFIQWGRTSWIALVSTNKLYGISFVTATVALVAVVMGGFLAVRIGVLGMVIGTGLGEMVNAILLTVLVSGWLGRSYSTFFVDALDIGAAIVDLRKRLRSLLERRGF